MEKSYLQYTGKGRIIIEILKRGKKETSRRRVPTSLISMEKRFFEENDILDARAIDYYEELEKLNVHLHLGDDEKVIEEDTIESPTQEVNEVEIETSEVIENSVEEIVEETTEDTTEVMEEIPTTKEEEVTSEEIPEELIEDSVVDESIFPEPIEESDRAEMIAYLDATYDKDGLKNFAKEFGVEFNSRISSEKLIEKLIDEKYPQILEMMK